MVGPYELPSVGGFNHENRDWTKAKCLGSRGHVAVRFDNCPGSYWISVLYLRRCCTGVGRGCGSASLAITDVGADSGDCMLRVSMGSQGAMAGSHRANSSGGSRRLSRGAAGIDSGMVKGARSEVSALRLLAGIS